MDYQSHLIYAVEFTVNDKTWVVVAPLRNSTFRYADKDAIRLPEDIASQIEYIKDLPDRETYLLTCKGYDKPVELNKIAARIVNSKKYLHQFHDYRQLFSWVERQFAVPAAEPKEKNVSAHSLHILEDKIASMDRIFGRKLEELAMMVGKLQANENRHTQPSENRDGQKRADGFYVVSYPGIEELFVVRSKDNVWYFLPPGKEVKYSGYLTIHSKLNMYE